MSLTTEQKIKLFKNLVMAMTLDKMMMRIIHNGKMIGFYHEGGIALAPGVAAGTFLKQNDSMWPHYRAHGIAHMIGKEVNIRSYVAEHMGREDGCCAGRSSFHWSFPEQHIFGSTGNIGGNFPTTGGYGLAAKYRKTRQIVMTCSGDGSYAEGRAHEAMLMSANWTLPVVFWCESNGMSQHANVKDLFPGPDISSLAGGFNIPSMIVDGQDLFACGEAALKAIEHTRNGKGPIFVECKTLRSQEHSVGSVNNEGAMTRDPELMEEWKQSKNPQTIASDKIMNEKILTKGEIDQIIKDAEQEADEIEEYAESCSKAMPSLEELKSAVYAA